MWNSDDRRYAIFEKKIVFQEKRSMILETLYCEFSVGGRRKPYRLVETVD